MAASGARFVGATRKRGHFPDKRANPHPDIDDFFGVPSRKTPGRLFSLPVLLYLST
jgi:hypothetical protein